MVLESLVDKQKDAVLRVLNLNKDVEKGTDLSLAPTGGDVWKVLVYDPFTRDVISPILKRSELRKMGITLELNIDADRQGIPEVPAVYLVEPTRENVAKIIKDCESNLYDSCHINFVSPVPRPILEDLAAAALRSDCIRKIKKVFDQHLNFITLEPALFSLGHRDSYQSLHTSSLTDTQLDAMVERIAAGLFSVLANMGVVPVIRAPRGEAAEQVAIRLESKLRENITSRSSVFTEMGSLSSGFLRPVLILTDRSLDLPVCMHHAWTYKALVHDLLGMHANLVTVERSETSGAPAVKKTYTMETSDPFWAENSGAQFQTVSEKIDAELNRYRVEMEEVNRKTGINFEDPDASSSSTDLASVVSQVPELRERKKRLDMHTNIAYALLDQIKRRSLDAFYGVEETIINREPLDRAELQALLSDPEKGTPDDKLRLYSIFYLCTDGLTKGDTDKFEETLRALGVDLTPLGYLKKIKAFSRMTAQSFGASAASSQKTILSDLAGKAKTFGETVKMFGMGLAAGIRTSTTLLPLTRVVESIMEMKPSAELDSYIYLDPKMPKVSGEPPRQRSKFRDAIVFVVGAGNFIEYQNLADFAKSSAESPRSILYGTTELVTGKQFAMQLSKLGSE